MNLNTIVEVKRPTSADQVTEWRDGYAWLAGGTWLFSEPQVTTDTLIDLDRMGWTPLSATPAGLEIAATCRIADLHAFKGPTEWRAVPLFRDCIDAFLMSFKIWNAATVGGNLCMSLPAGAMISLTAALEAVCTLWPRGDKAREVAVGDEARVAQGLFPKARKGRDIQGLEERIDRDPLAAAQPGRLDGVLHRARAVDLDFHVALAQRLGEEVVELLVEPEDRARAGHCRCRNSPT